MKEFRVTWTQCPLNYNPKRVIFVTAASEDDARKLARDYVERKHGVTWFVIDDVKEAAALPAGHVTEEKFNFKGPEGPWEFKRQAK